MRKENISEAWLLHSHQDQVQEHTVLSPGLSKETRDKQGGVQTGKEIKVSLFAYGMILYMRDSTDNIFSKEACYKINMPKQPSIIPRQIDCQTNWKQSHSL